MAAREVRITVRGRLTQEIGSRFDGMHLEARPGATVLVGEVVDSAALYGVIDRLRDLGLDLVGLDLVGLDLVSLDPVNLDPVNLDPVNTEEAGT